MRVYPKTRIGCNQFAALQGPAAAWQKFVPRCDDGVVSLWASINAFHTASWLFESADIS